MTNDQSPVHDTQQRAPYETPVVIELSLSGGTDGKTNVAAAELFYFTAPS